MAERHRQHQHTRPKQGRAQEHTVQQSTPRTDRIERPRSSLPDATELVSQLNDALKELADELSQGKSERLQDYLAFAARFHHYSRANQWLIQAQMPTATWVASYRKWQDEGYQVAKGAKGIRILAPSIRRIRPEPTTATTNEKTEAAEEDPTPKTIVRFVAVSVFDVSQLTPEKRPPEFFTPLAGDADALYTRLVEAATADGFTVEQSAYTHGAEGLSQGRRIMIRSDLTSINRFLTTLHEYAHGLLHWGLHPLAEQLSTSGSRDLSKVSIPVKECHAEATAYVVAKHFGLPNPFTSDYLLHWGTTPESLRNELDVVLAASSHIIGKLEGHEPEPTPEDPILA